MLRVMSFRLMNVVDFSTQVRVTNCQGPLVVTKYRCLIKSIIIPIYN